MWWVGTHPYPQPGEHVILNWRASLAAIGPMMIASKKSGGGRPRRPPIKNGRRNRNVNTLRQNDQD